YIRVLQTLGLAKVRRVAPRLRLQAPTAAGALGPDQLQGIIAHRYEVLARYSGVVKAAVAHELKVLKLRQRRGERLMLRRCRKWLVRDAATLAPAEQAQVDH